MAKFKMENIPKKYGAIITLRFEKDLRNKLTALKKKHKISYTEIVRQMIIHCLKDVR